MFIKKTSIQYTNDSFLKVGNSLEKINTKSDEISFDESVSNPFIATQQVVGEH
jgi:hypothetical protein